MSFTNRLASETSPYLLQHAHNPVDWYPWGPEAFEKAKAESKPIFLSVGYSTCYWCHVMERQCFEQEHIARVMNEKFINIKVDREERPDVDQLYMTAVQVLTRQGGWPMSVFLTPKLEPFFGGTYFPPEDHYNRPGFLRLLGSLEGAYRTRQGDIQQTTEQLRGVLQQMSEPRAPGSSLRVDATAIEGIIDRSVSDFDSVHGGFGGAPKFPRETLLQLLLMHHSAHPSPDRLKMLTQTLDALADGGIRDQLGGGFHRYSTDAKWLVPHFEIMLYDNAMLGWVYVEAFGQTGVARYAKVAREIFDFVLREMTSPQGPFYTAFDAEVDSMEGLNYLWTAEEIEELLPDATLFMKVYGVDEGPNFVDPHHGGGAPDKNILFLPRPLEEVAAAHGLSVEELESKLQPMRQKLLEARSKRKQPLLDTKILTSWNALMIRAMAYGGKVLAEPRYTAAAEKAALYLLEHHRVNHQLYRTSRDGSAPKVAAFLDDHAFLADALLELGWRDKAAEIADAMIGAFAGPRGGFYFSAASAGDLIVRQMVGSDSPLPSGNGIAVKVMLELGRVDLAKDTLVLFAPMLLSQGEGMSALVEAASIYVDRHGPLKIEPGTDGIRPQPTPYEIASRVLTVNAAWVSPTELKLQVRIQAGYHVQANRAGKGLIATTLGVPSGATVEYPAGKLLKLEFADEAVEVYSNLFAMRVKFDESPTSVVKLGLTYQACDESACLPAVTLPIEVRRNQV
jgi:uncharacterized protein YyaL (SSP411 family)